MKHDTPPRLSGLLLLRLGLTCTCALLLVAAAPAAAENEVTERNEDSATAQEVGAHMSKQYKRAKEGKLTWYRHGEKWTECDHVRVRVRARVRGRER